MLGRMPWHGIPLTKSIKRYCKGSSSDDLYDKINQAKNIYFKYVHRDGSHAVNISSDAVKQIEDRLNKLEQWKLENEDKFGVMVAEDNLDDDGIQVVMLNENGNGNGQQNEQKMGQKIKMRMKKLQHQFRLNWK